MVDYIEETEKFIKKRNNGEFVVTPIATQIYYSYKMPDGTPALRVWAYRALLADCLSNSIMEYESSTKEDLKLPLAQECYKWISIAWNTGAIKEGTGLAKQLADCREEKESIQNELATLSEDYKRLQNQLRALRLRFNLQSEDEGREKHR